MKFGEFVKTCNKMLEEHPEISDFAVVSAADEEGNFFEEVLFSPSIGDFRDHDFMMGGDDDTWEDFKANSICIN